MSSTKRPTSPSVRYLTVFGVIVTVILLFVLLTNYLIDPYLIHQWDSSLLQRPRPAREKLSPWGKTFAVFKHQPQVLYVGNSRTEAGLPADEKFFGGKRVFNGAISGASLGDAIAMLRHARAVSKLDTVVWGVDYWSFSSDIGNTDFDRELVAKDTSYALRRPLLDLKRSLSFDMSADSVRLILGSFGAVCRSSLAFNGQRDKACLIAHLGDRSAVAKALIADIQGVRNKNEKIKGALSAFRSELEQLCHAGIHVLLYINPLHAITLENFYQKGHGNDLEQWKRSLVDATDTAQQGGCNVQLFDFSGFNSVTTETIPEVSGKDAMQNYWEGSHYRAVVGEQILAEMIPLPQVPVPFDFGVKLDRSNIENHLAHIRAERELYRAGHPQELALLVKWFGSVEQKP